jgi:hypothetical protein
MTKLRKKRKEDKRVIRKRKIRAAYEKYRDHQYFLNIKRRIEWDDQYHEIRIKYENRIVCAYCGMTATGMDHFIPLSQVEEHVEHCEKTGKIPQLFKVSCCAECNRLLGPSTFSTFEIKLKHLRMRLERKYKDSNPNDRLLQGRLKRRLTFDRGLKRINGVKLSKLVKK